MAVSTLRVQIITSAAELWALGPEWRALETKCALDLPFQTWEWATSWWSHLHEERTSVRDALRVCVVRTDADEVVGIAPLMLTERPSFGPLRVRVMQFIGADPNITELRLMLCNPLFEQDCRQAVMNHLASMAHMWDWVAWEGLRLEIGAVDGTSESFVSVEEKSAFVIGLPSTWDEFRAGLGRNVKESMRHCYNSLKRDGLTYKMEALTEPEQVVSALSDFFRLHAERASFKGALEHTDVFKSPRAREFLIEVCGRLAKRGTARVFQLWVDDRLVATRIGFTMGNTLYLYYSGWDPAYSRYSVMTTLLAEVLRYAITHRLGHVNLSTGNDVSKTRWGAHEVRYTSGRLLSPRVNARAIHYIYVSAVRARTSRLVRALTPGFLVRGTQAGAAPHPAKPLVKSAWMGKQHTLGAVTAAVATALAVDLLDGVLDGAVHLLPMIVG